MEFVELVISPKITNGFIELHFCYDYNVLASKESKVRSKKKQYAVARNQSARTRYGFVYMVAGQNMLHFAYIQANRADKIELKIIINIQ